MQDKVAIGILMNSLDMGGAEKQSLLQAKLMEVEFEVYYFVQKKKPRLKQHMDFIEKEQINYIQLNGSVISRAIQLNSYIRKYNIKVIFAYLTLDNFLAGIVSLFRKIKYIGGVRSSSLHPVKFWITFFLQKYILDYMIFNNYYGKDLFVNRGFSANKSIVIQNCINNIQPEIRRAERDTINVLSVGRFTALKDYFTALKAMDLLKERSNTGNLHYTIVGDGELFDQIQSWIKELELSSVTVVRNPDDLDKYYRNADIYILSSDSEGLPNTIMEAFNYSLPVVSTDVGDAAYLVKESETGYLIKPKDHIGMAEKIRDLADDASLRKRLGINGHRLLVREFSEKKLQQRYNDFTRQVLSPGTT